MLLVWLVRLRQARAERQRCQKAHVFTTCRDWLSQSNFHIYGSHRYCWYRDGRHGPGFYRCGYGWDLGWGGGRGWQGWRGAHRYQFRAGQAQGGFGGHFGGNGGFSHGSHGGGHGHHH